MKTQTELQESQKTTELDLGKTKQKNDWSLSLSTHSSIDFFFLFFNLFIHLL